MSGTRAAADDALLRSLVNDHFVYEMPRGGWQPPIDRDARERLIDEHASRAALHARLVTAQVTLVTDGKARTRRFAICAASGTPIWCGVFPRTDREFRGDQASAEMAAARRAVRLAAYVMSEIAGAKALRLVLKVDAQWLTFANSVGSPDDDGWVGGKSRALRELALTLGIDLVVGHIPGIENPADQFTEEEHGERSWRDCDLARLVEPLR